MINEGTKEVGKHGLPWLVQPVLGQRVLHASKPKVPPVP